MLKKLLILVSLFALTLVAVSAQQPEAPAAPAAPRPFERAMAVWGDDGGYLGIMTVGITSENSAKFGLKDARGVGIEKVMENSPASQAGLQNGDVILRFDGEEVKSPAKLSRLIGEVAPDQKVRITILRGSNEQELTATIGKRPAFTFERMAPMGNLKSLPNPPAGEFKLSDDFFKNFPKDFPGESSFVWNFSSGRKLGIVAEPLTKQLGETFGVVNGKGLLLMEVREDSPAAKAGLKAGDIITEVDGAAVADSMELVRAVNAKKEGDVEITFFRNKDRQKVRVTPEQAKEGELPTVFHTIPGTNGEKQTFVIPAIPEMPNAPVQPGAIQAVPAIPAAPGVRVFRRVI
jgi:membrane-associated protease RseP (regulator of RpoE activity)